MTERVQVGGIQIAKNLYDFVNNEAIPGTGVDADKFWAEFDKIVNELAPRNRDLLVKRDEIQEKMDTWNRDHKGQKLDMAEYKAFLKEIRSEEHTSELQSRPHLVCRLLLEKKKKKKKNT